MITEKKLKWYYGKALATAEASPDEETKVASLLIHQESGAVISEGFNGFIRDAEDSILPKTRPDKYDVMIHAECNMLCNAVQHGVSSRNCVVFCTLSPCVKCTRMLYQAGIRDIYIKNFYRDFEENQAMKDLELTVTTIGEFSRITLEPKRKT